jgi:protein-S-isoprenylcysteine O-methyltransferase Ste14
MKPAFPPALQTAVYAALSWFLVNHFPEFRIEWNGFRYLAAGLITVGLVIIAIAIGAFVRAKTTINPVSPDIARKLVTKGLYRISRNPMYFGMLLLLVGWAVYLQNPLGFGPTAMFIVTMTTLQIKPEEKALRNKFGSEYDAYCKRVRRWI